MNGTHALGGFLGRKASAAGIPLQKLLSKFYACRTELMRVGAGSDLPGRTCANTVLKERLCS